MDRRTKEKITIAKLKNIMVNTSKNLMIMGWLKQDQSTLYLYHFKTGKKKKVSKLYDCSVVGFIEDDIILYKKNKNEEKKGKGYTYSSYSMLKVR